MAGQSQVMVVSLPLPWPVSIYSRQTAFPGEQYVISTHYTPFGQIVASVDFSNSESALKCYSPVIRIIGAGVAQILISIVYDDVANSLRMFLNGAEVGPTSEIIEIVAEIHPFQRIPKQTTRDEIGLKSTLKRRAQTATDYRKNRTPLQLERSWSDLRRECRLLRKAIDELKAGDIDEVVGVSLHLRKLINTRQGDRVLQDCAALKSKSLIVWTRPPMDPRLWTPIQIKENMIYWGAELFSLQPNELHSHSTDLDVWLLQSAGVFNGVETSNIKKLTEIADKIGAHLDNNRLQVEIMERFKIHDTDVLSRYLIDFGELVLSLAADLQQSAFDA